MTAKPTLYHYWRSSASWRVRWAFALKNIECEFKSINLLTDEAESPEHRARNPMGYVPVLELCDSKGSRYISQSLAITDWAEHIKPTPSLYPKDLFDRAYCIQLAEMINADTAPLQNLPPQFMYSDDSEKRKAWARHWIENGLSGYEKLVARTAKTFSCGDQVTLADLCLVPQVYNALRYEVHLAQFPIIKRIYETARETNACKIASPEAFEPKPK